MAATLRLQALLLSKMQSSSAKSAGSGPEQGMHAAALAAFFYMQTSREATAMPVRMFLKNNIYEIN